MSEVMSRSNITCSGCLQAWSFSSFGHVLSPSRGGVKEYILQSTESSLIIIKMLSIFGHQE